MQFYAIEIARYVLHLLVTMRAFTDLAHRNKNGLNDWIYEKAQAE